MQISISNSIRGFRSGNLVKKIVKDFKARVLADGGTFEAEQCLITQIQELINIPYIEPLILNQLSVSSSAAYSLRKLDKNYTGFAIRVRRSVDNAEMNIGFLNNGELDTTTLLNFVNVVGVSNFEMQGHITTWYDQSGNGRHISQPIAANQPLIVENEFLITENGKPAISFDGSTSYLFNNTPVMFDPTLGNSSIITYRQKFNQQSWILAEGNNSTITPFYIAISTSNNGLLTRLNMRSNTSATTSPAVIDGTVTSELGDLKTVAHIDDVNNFIGLLNNGNQRNVSYTRPTGGITLNTFALGAGLRTTPFVFSPINVCEVIIFNHTQGVNQLPMVNTVSSNQISNYGIS